MKSCRYTATLRQTSQHTGEWNLSTLLFISNLDPSPSNQALERPVLVKPSVCFLWLIFVPTKDNIVAFDAIGNIIIVHVGRKSWAVLHAYLNWSIPTQWGASGQRANDLHTMCTLWQRDWFIINAITELPSHKSILLIHRFKMLSQIFNLEYEISWVKTDQIMLSSDLQIFSLKNSSNLANLQSSGRYPVAMR